MKCLLNRVVDAVHSTSLSVFPLFRSIIFFLSLKSFFVILFCLHIFLCPRALRLLILLKLFLHLKTLPFSTNPRNFVAYCCMTSCCVNFDYILIPIHEAQLHHWFMIIVDVKKKIIGSFDSMQIDNAYELEHVLQLLVKHAKAIEDIANETADWQIFSDLTVPRQENSFDCGVYACQYAQYVTKKKFFDFRQSQMNYFRKRMKYELLKGIILEN